MSYTSSDMGYMYYKVKVVYCAIQHFIEQCQAIVGNYIWLPGNCWVAPSQY
jgi:hypothetical protein